MKLIEWCSIGLFDLRSTTVVTVGRFKFTCKDEWGNESGNYDEYFFFLIQSKKCLFTYSVIEGG